MVTSLNVPTMSKVTGKEEEVEGNVTSGKDNLYGTNGGGVRLAFDFFVTLIMMIGDVIRYYLSKVIPALAEPRYDVADKVVLLTGAGGGFGRRLAEQLAAKGATVACIDIDKAANERCVNAANIAAEKIWGSKPAAFAFQANLAKREETQQVVKEIEEKFGRVDILISAAISYVNYHVGVYDDDEIDFLVDLNFKSVLWLIRAVLPGMRERNSGHIAVFSSAAALAPSAGLSIYAACKSALKGLMNSLYIEFQDEGLNIGVTTIYPFITPTSPIARELISSRLPTLDPEKAVKDIINAIETQELNLVLPRHFSLLAGYYGILPKEAIRRIIKASEIRIHYPGLIPKATVTVDKWNEIWTRQRGPRGEYLKVHDYD